MQMAPHETHLEPRINDAKSSLEALCPSEQIGRKKY